MADRPDVIVVGGGIAGLAAALRLSEHGLAVTLVERREVLGGRASSFKVRPGNGDETNGVISPANRSKDAAHEQDRNADSGAVEWVDNCQHVLMRCCVNLLDFYRRIGAEEDIEFYDRFLFVDQLNRRSTLSASRWLPAPLHLIPSLLRFRSMDAADKLGISYGMFRLLTLPRERLNDHTLSFSDWLRQNRQTQNAVECFWRPVVVSALNEEPETTAAPYAFQLFRRAFLSNRRAFEMGLPAAELADIYSRAGGAALTASGAVLLTGRRVTRVLVQDGATHGVVMGDDTIEAGAVILAVPPHVLPTVLDADVREQSWCRALSGLQSSPITGIHLWFDRPVADHPHVALLGREMQWIFSKDWRQPKRNTAADLQGNTTPVSGGGYLGLVVSASRSLTGQSQAEILKMAMEAVHAVFPRSRSATVVREAVIREPRATFSPRPGAEALRPPAATPVKGLYLAGDWTQTGWPATMEGAVRGGYLAAQSLLADRGVEVSLLCPEMDSDRLPALLGL